MNPFLILAGLSALVLLIKDDKPQDVVETKIETQDIVVEKPQKRKYKKKEKVILTQPTIEAENGKETISGAIEELEIKQPDAV